MMIERAASARMPSPDGERFDWRWRALSWRGVLRCQVVAASTMLLSAVPGVLLLLTELLLRPATRPFLVYDATISYQHNSSTIPFWAAWAAPFAALLATLLACELGLVRRCNRNLTNALAQVLHYALDAACALLVTALLTEVGKNVVGKLRPDFLARCEPVEPSNGAYLEDVLLQYGGDVAVPACSQTGGAVEDGRRSFPSGHSSSAAVMTAYTAVYTIWTVAVRPRRRLPTPPPSPRHPSRPFKPPTARQGLRAGLAQGMALYWALLNMSYAYGVGLSRVVDNKHETADVVGGWVLGMAVAACYVPRAIALREWATAVQEGGGAEEREVFQQTL